VLAPTNEWFRKPTAPTPSLLSFNTSFSSAADTSIDDDAGPTRTEGEAYLSTPKTFTNGSAVDVLQWWRENEHIYPHLAQVAKDVFAVQLAQVGVERVFNRSKDTIGDRRHNLAAQTLREIMILRSWISGGQPIVPVGDSEPPPSDEAFDLLELPVPVERSGGATRFRSIEEVDDAEVQETPSRRQQPTRPTRNRQAPRRFRDSPLATA
jgi:hypothetical protein